MWWLVWNSIVCNQFLEFLFLSSLGAQWPRQIGYNPVFQNEELKVSWFFLIKSFIEKIATELDRSVAQIVLRWQLSLGIAVIPRSRKENRLQENFDLNFDLSDAHINSINNLDGKLTFLFCRMRTSFWESI